MDQGLFISLLNPTIGFVLSAVFLMLWFVRRQGSYILTLAASYFAVGIGFVLQGYDFGMGFEPSKLLSCTLFFAATYLAGAAVIRRQNGVVPKRALALCAGAGLTAFAWMLFGEPNFVGRIFAVNFGIGAMCAIIWMSLRRAPRTNVLDTMLVWLAALRALDFFIRPLVIAALDGGAPLQSDVTASSYWLATSLSSIIFSILIALLLLLITAHDVIRELQAESHTDALSGLLNRRGFEERTRPLLEQTGATPIGVVLSDLDHFKSVNDSHGHAVGDAVIVAFARLLRQAGAGRATIGRIGGEEFAVLIPHCDLAGARLFAEGARTALGGLAIDGLPRGRTITASFGVAVLQPGEDVTGLMCRADRALYDAKRAGRDCVRAAAEEADRTDAGRRSASGISPA